MRSPGSRNRIGSFFCRASRQARPAAEQVLASDEVQVRCRFVEIALELKLPDKTKRAHYRHFRGARQLRRVPIPTSRCGEQAIRDFRRQQDLQHPLVQVGEQMTGSASGPSGDGPFDCRGGRPGFPVQSLEVSAPEQAEAVEVDDPDGRVRRVVLGKPDDLLRDAPWDPRSSDYRERRRTLSGRARRLKHGLGHERHEAITTAFRTRLHVHRVGEATTAGDQIRLEGTAIRMALDVPAGLLEQGGQQGQGEIPALENVGFPGYLLVFHSVGFAKREYHGHGYSHGHGRSHGHDSTSRPQNERAARRVAESARWPLHVEHGPSSGIPRGGGMALKRVGASVRARLSRMART